MTTTHGTGGTKRGLKPAATTQVVDEQIDIAAPLKIPKQIVATAEDETVGQLAKTLRERGLGNGIIPR
jgi:hypothetical protein